MYLSIEGERVVLDGVFIAEEDIDGVTFVLRASGGPQFWMHCTTMTSGSSLFDVDEDELARLRQLEHWPVGW